ncbi:MAG: glycosyltransferase, partial [bacterium]
MRKRICLIQPQPWFAITPMLMSMASLLDKDGWQVDIVYLDDRSGDIDTAGLSGNVSIHKIPGYHGGNPVRLALTVLRSLPLLWRTIAGKGHEFIVGVDPLGLIIATCIGLACRVRRIYCSLELYFGDEMKRLSLRIGKCLERWCSRRARFTLTQDQWRAGALSRENGIDPDRMLVLPNTTTGRARLMESDLLHRRFGLDRGTRIILYPCSPFAFDQMDALTRIADLLPPGYVIVIHVGWYPPNGIRERMGWRFRSNVIHSFDPFPFNELEKMYASAAIGVALYMNTDNPGGGKNQDLIGYSSGKFNLFLKCGKPVITTNQETFRSIFSAYRCGVAIDRMEEFPGAVE